MLLRTTWYNPRLRLENVYTNYIKEFEHVEKENGLSPDFVASWATLQ